MALNIAYTCDGPGCRRQGHADEKNLAAIPDGWVRVGRMSWSPVFHNTNCLTQWARRLEQDARAAAYRDAHDLVAYWKSIGQA